jgi:hypothetical protein
VSKDRFTNSKKKQCIDKITIDDIESTDLAGRCKFNFSYLDENQPAGQKLEEWSNAPQSYSLLTLNQKLKEYSKFPLTHWKEMRAGSKNLTVFTTYDNFPKNSKFKEPSFTPVDVVWGRFRLASSVRLIGFTIPTNMHGNKVFINKRNQILDSNTFYIVFLDKEHNFYCTETK